MIKQITILFVIFSFTIFCKAQLLEPYFSFGYGRYDLEDVKKMQDELLNVLRFEAKLTDNFPEWYNYEAGVFFHLDDKYQKLGIMFGGMSTASRASLKDYSASYVLDHKIRAYKIGGGYEVGMPIGNYIQIFGGFSLGATFTTCDVSDESTLDEDTITRSTKLYAVGVYFEPKVKIHFKTGRIHLFLQPSYMFNMSSPFRIKEYNDLYLWVRDRSVRPSFKGYRIRVGIAYPIGRL